VLRLVEWKVKQQHMPERVILEETPLDELLQGIQVK
jgi:hypothetical protein